MSRRCRCRDTDDAVVHAELADEVAGRLPTMPPPSRLRIAPAMTVKSSLGEVRMLAHVQVVGDDAQLPVIQQGHGRWPLWWCRCR